MATFNTQKVLYGSPSLIPAIAERIQKDFQYDGYDVSSFALSSGGYDISITKGGLFKAVLGMKTALKVTLIPEGNCIRFNAGVGIWGQQFIPTVISMLFFWPVLITQISGMIQQARLDDKALSIAQQVINNSGTNTAPQSKVYTGNIVSRFCTVCGTENPSGAKFCSGCGKAL